MKTTSTHQPDTVVDHAFHMPITAEEQREFNAIRELCFKDEYLSEGYRKSREPAPIIANKRKYIYGLHS